MTDRGGRPRVTAQTTAARGGRLPVAAVAGGLFCGVLIVLALQVRVGADPAIGAGPQPAAAPAHRS